MNLKTNGLSTSEKSPNLEKTKLKKLLINSGKILISIALLYFVFRKIPFSEVSKLWRNIQWIYFVPAALFFLFSQIISTKRLEIFFKANSFNLSFKSNLELYFLGMFYNFFIPGGIGGDAYKVYLLNKKFDWSAKKITASLFCDRLSGLIAICLIICILAFFSLLQIRYYFIPLFVIGIFAGYILFLKLFPTFKTIYWKTLALSFLVQIFQISCFILLLKSIGVTSGFINYSLLFLASSVLSLISFAGIGVREMLFLQAAKYFEFSPQYSISASLLFTIITAFFSLFGLFFQIRKLNLTLTEES